MAEATPYEHVPVLAGEVVAALLPALAGAAAGGVVVDCTVGGGGHAEALLAAAPDATLVGLDRDPQALEAAHRRLAPYGGRVRLAGRRFGELSSALEALGTREVRGVLYDLGVSSPHLDHPGRGSGYRSD